MLLFVLRRLAYGLLVMTLVVIAITSIIFLAPVDPAQLTFGQRSDLATVQAKTAELGLDQPLYVQLQHYLADLSPLAVHTRTAENQRKYRYREILTLRENCILALKKPYLRESYQSGRPVVEVLAEAIPATAILALAAFALAAALGIGFGIIAALRVHSWVDRTISFIAVLGYSVPSYVAAMLLALVFGYGLASWTQLDLQGSLFVLDDFGEWRLDWSHLLLPAVALGMRPVALVTQLTRSALLEVLSQDYVRTARAKGLPYRAVVGRHALRNALNPIVSALSGWFAALLTGAFFIETVFNFRGLGDVTVNALLNFDIPVVLGSVLFTAAVFIVVNLGTDLLYAWLDPRVRLK